MLFLCFSCYPGRFPSPAGLGMTSRADISMVRNMNCAYLSRMMCLFARVGIFMMRVSGRAGGWTGRTRVCIRSGYN